LLQSNIEEASAAARVGKTLCGRWHLDRLIDVGGMAAVYAATHLDGTRGAIKILKARAEVTPEVSCAFLRGGHPNAVRVLDDQVDDEGNVCVVMELLEGRTLREWAQSEGGKLAPDRVLRIVDQLLDGLAALHEAGIVHRDIKPENLFLTTSGQVKILDFGIAWVGEKGMNATEPKAGVVMGTPDFMSPEQARGRWDLVDAQSDLWSVGATAFTLLSGELVHNEPTLDDLLTAVFEKPARSLSAALPGAHPALVDVIDRSLQRRRADRWSDARAMQSAVWSAFRTIYGTEMRFAPISGHVRAASSVQALEKPTSPQAVVVARAVELRTIPRVRSRQSRRPRSAWVVAAAVSLASLLIELPGSDPSAQAHAGDAAVRITKLAERIEPSFAAAPASMATATVPPSPASQEGSIRHRAEVGARAPVLLTRGDDLR
jgi:serine/threonine protein kinase